MREYTKKLISESEDADLIAYVQRLNEIKTPYSPTDERYGDAISKNEVSKIINTELAQRHLGDLLCLPN